MKYVSTRGIAPELEFEDALLAGLARDGGLYVPVEWPQLSERKIRALAGLPYEEVAFRVMRPFIGEAIGDDDLQRMIGEAYASFRHKAIVPLRQLGSNDWLLELFHGPTLAFKDVAMQILARLFDHVLAAKGRRVTVVGATSGDTGSAAIEAFKGRDTTDIFILHPKGRVSEVQRRQMTTVLDANVHNIAIEGSFDDCQALVKAMFNDHGFRDEVSLAGVNSINWGRVMAQIVYFFTAAVALGGPARPVAFSVPTGNFGDIFAGYAAARMGLPIEKLIVATNVNDILARTMESGRYEVDKVVPTISPSMDIQVSSNFERLLFDAYGRDGATVTRLMQSLSQSGAFTIDALRLEAIRAQFGAARVDESETSATIKETLAATGELLDPHSAVGLAAAARLRGDPSVPMITLATAHPAKFPDAVKAATGIHPDLPPAMADIFTREERLAALPNDLGAVETFIRERARSVAA
ncbi:threonine synthase [Parvibaculum lavamentivorans DS-1]|uniref:Threonine synthase n=1 Tax=Parvibaculum lavamentivorans (strain DS-1 / DSM 13023 / NCIMB 13966) TaxID=402881 RepID=A7HQW7_PARL1|nr:threonine synthase [Parvibaculum lavamentivorans]ABS62300.1 threonine synthase [Parvibaculum lavamentivorans DS-1]